MDTQSKTRIIGAFVIGFSIVGGAYTISNFGKSSIPPPAAPAATASLTAVSRDLLPVTDTNADGIEDWRESFISGTLIKSFTLQKPNQLPKNYVSTLEFVDNYDKTKPGFFELLVDGKVKLLEYTKITIQKPDYVEAFNTGSKDIIMKDIQNART